jgi:hypothetical protein
MVLTLLLIVGCGSSAKTASTGTTTTTVGATTTSSTTTTTLATTTTTVAPTTTTTLGNGPANPEDAARGLYSAWSAGSRNAAAAFATQAVIDQVFANDGAGANWTFQMCDGVAGGAYCTFSYEGGGVQMHLVDLANFGDGRTGYQVDEIQFTAD